MKIKNDFVTNSSSTSYVFCIPESFKFTQQDIDKHINEYEIEGKDEELDYESANYNEKVLQLANEVLDILKKGGTTELEYDDNYEYELLRMISDIIPNELCITSVGSQSGMLIGIEMEDLKKVLEYENKK